LDFLPECGLLLLSSLFSLGFSGLWSLPSRSPLAHFFQVGLLLLRGLSSLLLVPPCLPIVPLVVCTFLTELPMELFFCFTLFHSFGSASLRLVLLFFFRSPPVDV